VGSAGIFTALGRAGVLDHGLPGVRDVEEAVHHPPARGRAHERGQAILRHCAELGRYTASWDVIIDHQVDRIFDLRDPFGANPSWISSSELGEERLDAPLRRRGLRLPRR
jgi:hypothetical protein